MTSNQFREQWEENAAAFADLIAGTGTPHHRQILNPCVERLLGDVRGKRLLDAGCGEGYLSFHYARKGAVVSGVDRSSQLIDTARSRARSEDVNIDFREGDICSLSSYLDGEFDLVLCNLVLLNVSCLDKAISEFSRVLRTGGELVLSVVHPAFDVYGPGGWEMGDRDPITKRRRGRYFTMDSYYVERDYERVWKRRDGTDFPAPITFFHRTISRYVNALLSAGFELEALEEPLPITNDDFFERERRIPFFLVIKARTR
jgi:ubiquinone/menaquinone biosynthesis C-methylase UbiE